MVFIMRNIQLPIFKYQIVAIILLLSFSSIATVSASEITVGSAGEDYSSISAALANATDGDTIIVSDGTYNENIVVDREVTIRSQGGAANTIVNSLSGSDTFDITASNVTINGFTVTGASASSMAGIYLESNLNCTISNNIVTANEYGIDLDSSSNNTLSNNNASLNDNYGISLGSSSSNSLSNNTANGNYYGINFYYSNNNELTNNNASNNENHGIYLSNSNNNELVNNHAVVNDYYGIYLTSSSSNNLTSNNVSGNNCGIRFSSSDNNNLTNNNAIDNYFGIRFFSSSSNNMTGNIMSLNTYNFNVNMLNSNMDDLLQDIDDSNKVDGKSIYYWTNRADEEVPSDAGIVYVVNSTNITVKDIEVTNEYSGIVFAYTINSTIENTTTSECGDGIYLYHSNLNELANNNASYNDYGIYLSLSSNNNITSNNASDNERGISLSSSSSNSLTINNASDNNYGIYLYLSDNNELTSNNANINDDSGIYFASSNDNYLISNNASDNNHGIYLSSSSNNNLTSNNVNNNDDRGICLSSSDYNNLTSNNATNNDNYGIYLSSSSGNNLTSNTMSSNVYNFYISSSNLDDYLHDIDESNTVDSKPVCYWTNRADEEVPSSAGVVYVINSTNITVKDIEVSNESYGIMFAYTINSTIENVTISECNYGIYLSDSDYNNLISNNANNYNDYGIYLYYSNDNNLTNNTANNNDGNGIYLRYSEYNDLTSNNGNNNNNYGIYVRSSDNNNLTNNNATNNNEKDLYAYSSSSCTVDRLALTDNLAQLSFVTDSSSTSIIGSETNANVLSGKSNVNGYTTIDRSGDLNVTFFYDDSGMSSSDESSVVLYRLDGSIWVEVANASLNTSGNCLSATLSEFGTFGIFRDTEFSSNPSSSPSSSGIRVSVSQGQNSEIVEATAASTLRVVKGTEVNYDFSDSVTPVLGVSFDAKDDEGLVVAKVQVLSDTPEGIPSPSGTSYQLMSIDVGNEGTISTDNAENVLILFKVSREWIEENDIDVSSIRMTRYHGEQWQNLPTIQVKEDDEFICFSAETPGFSVFNVVGDKIGEVVAVEETGTSLSADEETEPETKDTPGFTGLAGIVIVSLAFLVSRKLKSD